MKLTIHLIHGAIKSRGDQRKAYIVALREHLRGFCCG